MVPSSTASSKEAQAPRRSVGVNSPLRSGDDGFQSLRRAFQQTGKAVFSCAPVDQNRSFQNRCFFRDINLLTQRRKGSETQRKWFNCPHLRVFALFVCRKLIVDQRVTGACPRSIRPGQVAVKRLVLPSEVQEFFSNWPRSREIFSSMRSTYQFLPFGYGSSRN